MEEKRRIVCPDCGEEVTRAPVSRCHIYDMDRREFIKVVGGAVVAVAAAPLIDVVAPRRAWSAPSKSSKAETLVKMLYDTLTSEQKKLVALPWEDPRRTMVNNNWRVVEPSIGKVFTKEQKELLHQIFRSVTNDESYEKFMKQMQDDWGGFDNYSCAIFTDANGEKMEWVMTGRHLTIRADGNAEPGAAFGGPIFYGHAVVFTEQPDHPGNVWWHQARLANKVFEALDGKQKEKALLDKSPDDAPSSIKLKGPNATLPGIAVGELSRDQKELVEQVMRELLAPYRKEDVDEVMACIKANGGLDKIHLSFYKEEDLGNDGIWDRWKLEGPAFAWYFRGSPHVHTWINVRMKADA